MHEIYHTTISRCVVGTQDVDGLPSNGLAFSCGERDTGSRQKPNDLAREAVSCNAGLGRTAIAA